MISVFDLVRAVNESAEYNHSGGTNIAPMDIPETMNICESVEFVNYEIYNESAEFAKFASESDEILFEAAMTNPDMVGPMSESIIKNIGQAVKTFFQKIIAGAKAILNRMKEFWAKMFGKTNKWVELVKPRIKAARDKGVNMSDVTVQLHKWDTNLVMSGITNTVNEVIKEQENDAGPGAVIKADNLIDYNHSLENADSGDSAISKAIEDLDKEMDKIKEANEKYIKQATAKVIAKFGGSGDEISNIWPALDKKVRGSDKNDQKIGSVDDKVSFVEGAAKAREAMEKTYTDYIDRLEKLRTAWEGEADKLTKISGKDSAVRSKINAADKAGPDTVYGNNANPNSDVYKKVTTKTDVGTAYHYEKKGEDARAKAHANKAPTEYINKYQAYSKSKINGMMGMLTNIKSIVDGLQSRNLGYIREMCSEYMTAVTKAIGGAKKD